jgi:ATP-dependent Lhr-like helicase
MIAWQLLARWGVVFRRVLDREPSLPSWASLLRVYHRLEARGEIRGGRFVSRFSGEQFATPEAIAELRKVRRGAPSTSLIRVSGSDPLNLVGILTPGDRIPAVVRKEILIRGGVPVAVSEGGAVRLLPEPTTVETDTAQDGGPSPLSHSEAERAFRARPQLRDLEQRTAE